MIHAQSIHERVGAACDALWKARDELATAVGLATAAPEVVNPVRVTPFLLDATRLSDRVADYMSEEEPPQPHPSSEAIRKLADDLDRYHDGDHDEMVRAVGVELMALGEALRDQGGPVG